MYTAAAEAVGKVGIPRCPGFPSKVGKSVFDFSTLSSRAFGPQKLMKIISEPRQNRSGSERQDRRRNGDFEADALSDPERAFRAE
jgi:hypothetical protein